MKCGQVLFKAVLVMLLAACGQQITPTPTVSVEMSARAEPQPLAVGETTLVITLRDGSGLPVDNAALEVHGDMDHAGMVPVNRQASHSAGGEYRVPFEWTMGGGWIVTVTARLPDSGGEISQAFNFFVEAVSNQSVINRHGGMSSSTVNIAYKPDRDPAVGGDASVVVTLTDGEGSPITDAAVEIVGDMTHAGMMPIIGKGEHTGEGHYAVPLRWTMAGDWLVTVRVTSADGRRFEQVFNQQVVLP